MAINLETQAVIKAKDETGPGLASVESKLKRLARATRAVAAMPVTSLRQAAAVADKTDHIVGKCV